MKKNKKRRGRGCALAALAVFAIAVFLFAFPLRPMIEKIFYPVEYAEEVERWSAEYNVDPYLVYAVIRTESGFRAEVDSGVGARGLMQMTEETFEWLQPKIAPGETLTFNDLYKPATSVRFGTYFLSLCLERYGGDVSTAAAAYHSGWGTVDGLLGQAAYSKDGSSLAVFPYDQMAHYVNKVNKAYGKYKDLYAGKDGT